MNLKEKRLETGKQNRKINSEKKKYFFSMKKIGRQPLLSDEMFTEINSIFSSLRISEATITQKVVIAVGNRVLSARCPEKKMMDV